MASSNTHGNFDYDVLIVGGGPAGVSCAITVAQAGYSVVIVDKKSRELIGDKTCGDAVDLAALERLKAGIGIELPSGNEVSDEIKYMSIAAGDVHTKITLQAPGFVVDRLHFGQRLLAKAEETGVTIIPDTPVREILLETIDNHTYLAGIKVKRMGETSEIRAKFTIDASGAYAVIRRQLPDQLLNYGITQDLSDDELWPTYREIIKLNDGLPNHEFSNEIILLYKDGFAPPGYFWIFSKGNGELNCGIGWMKYQSEELGRVKEGYLKELALYYPKDSYTVIKKGGGQIPVRPPFDSLVFNGGAIAGDAACMVHPVTAEGHAPALDTGMHLGKSLISALEKGERSAESLWMYNVAVANHYGKKHMQALLLRDFLEKAGASNLAYLIKKRIFRNEELDLIFSGDEMTLSFMDKLSRVVKLIFRPRLLLGLKAIFDGMTAIDELYSSYPTDPSKLSEWRALRNKKLKVEL